MAKRASKRCAMNLLVVGVAIVGGLMVTPVLAQEYPSGIVSYWKFDEESGSIAKDSVGANDGTIYGATWTSGVVDGALSFDGVDDHVKIGNPTNLKSLPNGITIDAWVNPSEVPPVGIPFVTDLYAIVTKWGQDCNADAYSIYLYNYEGTVTLLGAIGVPGSCDSAFFGGVVPVGQWTHVAMTYDATTGVNLLYVNGQPVAERVRPGGITQSELNVLIGREDSSRPRPFKGFIDEVAIYDRALTGAEIQQRYQASAPAGMVSYWKFDEGSGTTATDSVNGNHGTIYGASWITGKVGGALNFDGIDDYINLGSDPSLEPVSQITLEAWVKPTAAGFYPIIIGREYDDTGGWSDPYLTYDLFLHSTSRTVSFDITVGGDRTILISGIAIPLNEWSHLVGTYDGAIMAIYINGVLKTTTPKSGGIDYTYPNPNVTIGTTGTYYNQQFFSGAIDEVAIYNRALTAEVIQQHYQNGLQGLGYEIGVKPIAVAEPGLDANNNLILDGSKSYDPDGIVVAWDWVLSNRDPEGLDFTFGGETVSMESVDIGVYDVTLTVTDDDGLTGTDATVVSVPAGLGVCPELQTLINNLISLLGVASEDEIIYAVLSLQSEIEDLSQQVAQLQKQLAAANETIATQADRIAGLEDELARCEAALNEARAKLNQISAALTSGLSKIEADFQTVFNDPDFVIPGATLLEKFDSLINAILGINKGRKMDIYENLGGKPGKGK